VNWIQSFRRTAITLLLPLALAGCAAHVMSEARNENERLAAGKKALERHQYTDAINHFKIYIANSTGQAQVDEVIYLLGVAYLDSKQYPLAQGEFERVLRDYPESDSAGASSFKLGEALLGQSRPRDFDQEYTERAVEQWQAYLRGYPDHWLNPEAQRRLLIARTRLGRKMNDAAFLYIKLKQYEPAHVYFERVMNEYGDTPAGSEAELGLARLDARRGFRPEAIERYKSIESRYPGQQVAKDAAKERAQIEKH
jgi:outer membrane assembly lipoprotein YfiO